MCRQLPPRVKDISDEEVGDAEEDAFDYEEEEDDDSDQMSDDMESLQQQHQVGGVEADLSIKYCLQSLLEERDRMKEELGFTPILMTAFLEYTSYHDLETEKGLEHLNVVLDFLGEEKGEDENWQQLSSGQKKEVFETLLSVDFVKEFEQGGKSEERVKAMADLNTIVGRIMGEPAQADSGS